MANDYYAASGTPATRSQGSSAAIRGELAAIVAAFDKLPGLAGNGLKTIRVNSGGTGLEAAVPTGTGAPVNQQSPTLVTPALGVASATTLTASGVVSGSQLTSTVAIGTPPLVVTSTTQVPNLYVARAVLADTATLAATATAVSLEATTAPSFVNSWTQNETVSFYKDGSGIVHLQGTLISGASGTVAFTLPAGYRPTIDRTFGVVDPAVSAANDKPATLRISSTGDVTPTSPGALNLGLTLNGITFRTT